MCRWFAYISATEPCLLEDVLITPSHALAKQVHDHFLPGLFHHDPSSGLATTEKEVTLRNRLFNTDGLGVGWYSTTRSEFVESKDYDDGQVVPLPSLYKTIQPPNNDPNFLSICQNNSSLCVFSHIRMSTSVVTNYNNHPFVFGRHSFMHNGLIEDFVSIKRELALLMHEDAFAHMAGTTDSETVAAIYITYLCDGGSKANWHKSYALKDMKVALEKTVQAIVDVRKKHGGDTGPNDLNLATTDGKQLLTFRFRNHPTEQPPSLYYSTTAGVRLNRKYPGHPNDDSLGKEENKAMKRSDHGAHVIVSSEPTTHVASEWKLIGKNEAVMVDSASSLTIEKINVNF